MLRTVAATFALSTCLLGQSLLSEDGVLSPDAALAGDKMPVAIAATSDLLVARGGAFGTRLIVWRRDPIGQWSQEEELTTSAIFALTTTPGKSVTASDNFIVAGNYHTSPGTAFVFAFDGTNWTKQVTLSAINGTASDYFGEALASNAERIVIGAPGQPGLTGGAVHVFRRFGTLWLLEQKLLPLDGSAGGRFGASVSVSEDIIAIGAPRDSEVASQAGAVYVFRYDGSRWIQEQKLVHATGAVGDRFGEATAISGDRILIGAPGRNTDDSGAATVAEYHAGIWSLVDEIPNPSPSSGDQFGMSLALRGDIGFIGSYAIGTWWGAIHQYRWTGASWLNDYDLARSSATDGEFGSTLAVSGDEVIAGSPLADSPGSTNSGLIYIFTPITPWSNLGHGLQGSSGTPVLWGEGTLESGSTALLRTANLLAGSSAYLVIGASLLQSQFKLGVMMPFPDIIVPGIPTGAGEITLYLPWPTGIPSAVPLYFQYWLKDPAGPDGWAGSNAISGTTP